MIEDGQVPFDELVQRVGNQERIWARVGAALVNSEWTVLAYDLVAPVAPPGWEEQTWQYPEAVFCAVTVVGPEAAEWLNTAKLTVCEKELALPGLSIGLYSTSARLGKRATVRALPAAPVAGGLLRLEPAISAGATEDAHRCGEPIVLSLP